MKYILFFVALLLAVPSCKTIKPPLMQVGSSGNLLCEGNPVFGSVGTVHKLFQQKGKVFGTTIYMAPTVKPQSFKEGVRETAIFYLFEKGRYWRQVALYTGDAYDRITMIKPLSEKELEVTWDGGRLFTKIKL